LSRPSTLGNWSIRFIRCDLELFMKKLASSDETAGASAAA